MKFKPEQFEELLESFRKFLDLLTASSYTSAIAKQFKAQLDNPEFTNDFWTKFNTNYKKLIQLSQKYVSLTNENPKTQLEVSRELNILKMIDPIDFVESFKEDFLAINTDDLAKKKLRVFVKAFLSTLSTAYKYVEKESNDYDILFDLQSVDGKRTLSFDCLIGETGKIQVFGEAKYKDYDFEFEIENFEFDSLRFPTLVSCYNQLNSDLELRIAMKISGTRLRIASYILVLSKKDLAMAKADLLKVGETILFTVDGIKLRLTVQKEGRLLDAMNTSLFGCGNLYFNVVVADTLATKTQQMSEVKELNKDDEHQQAVKDVPLSTTPAPSTTAPPKPKEAEHKAVDSKSEPVKAFPHPHKE